ncbi:MAG TPA: HupE/UreJ family protein [Vicinamibacterales bacterium]|nr:HupE/UreJ family protein [Vicinamibacterales bacterium]
MAGRNRHRPSAGGAWRRWLGVVAAAYLLSIASLTAHPAPFSYLDLNLDDGGMKGTLVVHDLDAAHDLGVANADTLLDPKVAQRYRDALVALLTPRIALTVDGSPATITWGGIDVVPDRQSLRLDFVVTPLRPGHIAIRAHVFPYDPVHQTFINVYEDAALRQQMILDAAKQRADYYSGTTQGRWSVVKTFVRSGIEHILIGPDHILFLIGLLLLGGTFARLALIVTAFTIGHSITLSLAALDVLAPSARFIEPLIALTIIVVGVDNLLVLRSRPAGARSATAVAVPETDLRPWLSVGFGLIHGFGFAYVLKEFGLPAAALGWSLFAFNIGVEAGQLLIVAVVASALLIVHRQSATAARFAAFWGSIAVTVAGAYWFIERVFYTQRG